jgi:DNA repair protein RecN (Recombination protein N)
VIERLRIEQLALVESLELEFDAGLNVLTGETGAGKSIVLGALELLAGGRARPEIVREGAERATIEAVFDTRRLPELEAALAARGLEAEGHELIVRRTVARAGRGRAWVGGQLVPVSALAELFDGRLEISSQHASQGLLRPEVQGRLLDAAAGLLEDRARLADGVRRLRERDEEIAGLRGEADERARREDYLAFQVREIDEAALDPEAHRQIEAEHGRLVHAERIQGDAAAAGAALQGDAASPEIPGAVDALAGAARTVRALAELDTSLAPLAERLDGAHAELLDAASDLERYASGVEADPARLGRVEEAIRQFEQLRRKYGETPEAILEHREEVASELATLSGSDDRLAKLEAEREQAVAAVSADAATLTKKRRKAAKKLEREALAAIRVLALGDARFEVALLPAEPPAGLPCGPGGAETVEILFSANPGEALHPLRKVASGGELSRIFLALKNVLRRGDAGMVLVFDEVDAGIGGAVAEKVGEGLADLAGSHQVLCITHLPQIASHGSRHFQVQKGVAEGRTATDVTVLSEKQRVDEIARMAGGETIDPATRRHARALLAAAGAKRRDPGRG